MISSRRDFLKRSSFIATGFFSLRRLLEDNRLYANESSDGSPYGPLISDPQGMLDLPPGFSYKVISRSGSTMQDGFIVPGLPDGMATFAGPNGLTLIIRNHELLPDQEHGPFGEKNRLFGRIDPSQVYDAGKGNAPHRGGTTTVVFDTRRQEVVREFLSLAGTARNCAGGPTPWNSWITCEETVLRKGPTDDGKYQCERDHGYNFEVPASDQISLADPVPLTEMGRFNHEAIAVDPNTGIVYQTEDRHEGLIYRFLPNEPGTLAAGGKLEALAFRDTPSLDTRNWDSTNVEVGKQHSVMWIPLEEVTSPKDDLRFRGFSQGAARFTRGEGMWYSQGQIFFACTNGGRTEGGQIWRLLPDSSGRKAGDKLELFLEPNDSRLLQSADNLTVAPWGDLIVCEDRSGEEVRLIGAAPDGTLYTFANNHVGGEFAGVTFSPDGSTLFVNLQTEGLTVAITGPWAERDGRS